MSAACHIPRHYSLVESGAFCHDGIDSAQVKVDLVLDQEQIRCPRLDCITIVNFCDFFFCRRNIPSDRDIKSCVYDPDKDPLCPIIKLGTIVKQAGEDYKSLAYKVFKKEYNLRQP